MIPTNTTQCHSHQEYTTPTNIPSNAVASDHSHRPRFFCPRSYYRQQQSNPSDPTNSPSVQDPPTAMMENHGSTNGSGWWGSRATPSSTNLSVKPMAFASDPGNTFNRTSQQQQQQQLQEQHVGGGYPGAASPNLWEYRHYRRYQMGEAERTAELIGTRNFEEEHILRLSTNHNSVFPTALGYGLLAGGVALVALKIPGRVLARRLGPMIGNHATHTGLKVAGGVAVVAIGSRYAHRYQTLENLKIMGTYVSPYEPCASADAICQHPLITKAIQQREHLTMDDWYRNHGSGHYCTYYGGPPTWFLKDQIMTEYERVLENCQQRRQAMLENNNNNNNNNNNINNNTRDQKESVVQRRKW